MANDPQQHDAPPLDEVSAERLLRGERPSAGATAGEQALGELLAFASAPPSARELSGEARAVAAFTASRSATTGPRHSRSGIRRRRSVIRPRIGHGVAAAAAFGALTIGGVAAAAYTGSLPTPIQRLAHDHIGAPHARQPRTTSLRAGSTRPHSSSTAVRPTTPTAHPAPPGLSVVTTRPTTPSLGRQTTPTSSPAANRYQLCTAYSRARTHADQHAIDNALRKLEQAAGGPAQVAAYCAPVWPTPTATTPKPTETQTPSQTSPEPHDSGHPSQQHTPITTVPPGSQGRRSG